MGESILSSDITKNILDSLRQGDMQKAKGIFEDCLYSSKPINKYIPAIYQKGALLYQNRQEDFEQKKLLKGFERAAEKILSRAFLKIAFVNDMGFNAGAGIALKRQCEAFLMQGHEVILLSAHHEPVQKNCDLKQIDKFSYKSFYNYVHGRHLTERGRYEIEKEIAKQSPDFIITGNFHAHHVGDALLQRLKLVGIPMFVYAHDCDWMTGGCAHALYYKCQNYLKGCLSSNCLKNISDYPPTPSFEIESNWVRRGELFNSDKPLPIVTNSVWMQSVFNERFPMGKIEKIPLSLNTKIFYKRDRFNCRGKLSLPSDKTLVMAGAASLSTRGKGLETLLTIFEASLCNDNYKFVVIGNSEGINFPENVISLGHIGSERELSEVYCACDIYISPSKIESFGQTLLESIACGTPVITYNSTGIGEISVDDLSGLHACDENDFINRINILVGNSELYDDLVKKGRVLVDNHFTHDIQVSRWFELIRTTYYQLRDEVGYIQARRQSMHLERRGVLPSVSIITPTFNPSGDFVTTAESIISQQGVDVEWIVVDGLSESKSIDIIQKYMNDISHFVSEKDDGIYDAMNKGLNYATGDLVYFMGAGDYFSGEGALRNAVRFVHENPKYDVYHGEVYEHRIDGTVVVTNTEDFSNRRELLSRSFNNEPPMRGIPPHQGVLCRKKVFDIVKFDVSFKVSADWNSFFEMLEKGLSFKKLPGVLAWYPNGGFSAAHSVRWLTDCKRIFTKYYKDKEAVSQYMDRVISNQKKVAEKKTYESKVLKDYEDWLKGGYSNAE